MNFADAAAQILKENGAPLPVVDITQRALQQGLINPKSDNPVTYVRAAIRKDNRRREGQNQPPRFRLVSPGIYNLS
jgi:HB1, ASXL, restriction endonuclease HTH domain